MIQLDAWRQRLKAVLRGAMNVPLNYGRHDCALFAAACCVAVNGRDPMRGHRGYRTLAEGLRNLKRKGHADHIALFAAQLDEIPIAQAVPGDVVALPGEGGTALGIVQGATIYVVGRHGLVSVPLSMAERAFRA